MKKRKFAIGGRYFILPDILRCGESFVYRAYEPVGFRCPRRGEHFVSGAIPEIFYAPNDLSNEYLVVNILETLPAERN